MDDEGEATSAHTHRAEVPGPSRDLLLEAAARTFAGKGFAGSSDRDIAAAAGMPVDALHAEFASKDELLLAVLAGQVDERIAEAGWLVESSAASRPDAAAAMSRLLVAVADKDADSASLQAELWLYATRHPAAMERLADQARAIDGAIGEVVRARFGRLDPGVEVPVEPMATVLSALFEGLVQRRRTDPTAVPDELFGQALQWLIAGVATIGRTGQQK